MKARDESGRLFDVEIQVIGNSRYIKRSLYYWARNYQGQLVESDSYEKLSPVICVNILNFVLFGDLKQAYSCFLPTERMSNEYVLTDDFQIHFFELPKMNIEEKKILSSRLEKWAFFFRKEGLIGEENEMKILLKNDPVMEHAHKNYKKFTADDELFEVYEAREKRIRDEKTLINSAREEGLHQGLQQGKRETLQSIVVNMKRAGVAVEIICKSTGLSEEEIDQM